MGINRPYGQRAVEDLDTDLRDLSDCVNGRSENGAVEMPPYYKDFLFVYVKYHSFVAVRMGAIKERVRMGNF